MKSIYTQEQINTFSKAGRDAAVAMDELVRRLDLLPKKKPPPLWLRRFLS